MELTYRVKSVLNKEAKMKRIFESDLKVGFLDLYEGDQGLIVSSGFRREAKGVALEIPAAEAADLAEALLGRLDKDTRLSVIGSVFGHDYKLLHICEDDSGQAQVQELPGDTEQG